jgi:hypothetical protein
LETSARLGWISVRERRAGVPGGSTHEVFFRFLRPNCASARARIATTPGAVDVARECFVTDLSTSALVQSRASNLEVFAGRAPAARVAFPRGRAHHLRRENGLGIRTRGRNPI